MELKYSHEIAKTLGFSLKQIDSIAQLHSEGSTIPFIARYRKEATWKKEKKPLLKQLKAWAS